MGSSRAYHLSKAGPTLQTERVGQSWRACARPVETAPLQGDGAKVDAHASSQGDERSRLGQLFETYVAVLIGQLGYEVELTAQSHDRGADLIVRVPGRPSPTYCLQCKASAEPVGLSAIQEVYTARALFGADEAVIVTTAGLTTEAGSAAAELRVVHLVVPINRPVQVELPTAAARVQADQLLPADEARAAARTAVFEVTKLGPMRERLGQFVEARFSLVDTGTTSPKYVVDGSWLDPGGVFGRTQEYRREVHIDARTGEVTAVRRPRSLQP